MELKEVLNDLKGITAWLFMALIGVLLWFFKSVYSEFNEMKTFFNKWRDIDIKTLSKELEDLKIEVKKIELESKRYWNEHKNQMESNQQILLERINHTNENNKAAAQTIKEFFEALEKRLERLENKI